ncbi:UNVERIFIED_CONTAM: hypothetical protein GTU68_020965, partial [Idotea baltica]|nr:hypothetical protein [Idotea baltica]
MAKEILLVAEAVSNEKGVDRGVIFEAIEQALATATRKRFKDDIADIRVAINDEDGSYETFRRWQVVDDNFEEFDSELHLYEDQAEEKDASLALDDYYEEQIENSDFGRIAAQTAKQVIVQKVRDAERAQMIAQFAGREGELLNGSVKKVTRDNIIVDLDIILWDDNPAQLVINALAPAEVESIVVDEDSNTMDVAVKQDNLAQAIGRSGQNVRLASELTGWNINVMSEEEAVSKQ